MNVYIINPRKDFTSEQLRRLDNINTIFIDDISEISNAKDIYLDCEKIIAISPDYTNWEFSNDLINSIPNIKALCLGTTAYYYIDLEYCNMHNILVTNIPQYATDSVAEYLMFFAMSLSKKLPLQIKNSNRQDFSNEYMNKLLSGKTVGIIGLGNIGKKVADICKSINMNILYWSKNSRDENYELVELNEIFEKADFIFLTLSINNETKKIITDDLLNKMKHTTCFISGTGKELHNHNLLIEKVENKEIFGYALEEANKNLFDYEGNVMVTSEYGWYTQEATEIRMNIWIDNIEGVLNNNSKSVVR